MLLNSFTSKENNRNAYNCVGPKVRWRDVFINCSFISIAGYVIKWSLYNVSVLESLHDFSGHFATRQLRSDGLITWEVYS